MLSYTPFVLLSLSILSFVFCYLSMRNLSYSDITTSDQCNEALLQDMLNYKEGNDCHAWDDTQCRKGKFKNENCEYEGSYLPLILLITALILLGWSVFSFYKEMNKDKDNKENK